MYRQRDGFTLIELLVVIAIIAILAAILFPVFARAKEKAKQATCLSNEKQILLSILMYNSDYDDTFPTLTDGQPAGGNLASLCGPYVKNTQIFWGPTSSGLVTDSTGTGYVSGTAEVYGVNWWNGGGGSAAPKPYGSPFGITWPGQSPAWFATYGVPVTQGELTDPPNCLLIACNNAPWPQYVEWQADPTTGWRGDWYPSIIDQYAPHNGMMNVGFADGHVKAVAPGGFVYNWWLAVHS